VPVRENPWSAANAIDLAMLHHEVFQSGVLMQVTEAVALRA
jgi:hypothetical protein